MWFRIRIDAQRTAMQIDLVHDSGFEKCVNSLVDRRQRHRRHLPADLFVNLFRIRMSRKRSERLEDHRPLMRSGQAMLMAKLAKRLRGVGVMFVCALHKGIDEENSQRIRVL